MSRLNSSLLPRTPYFYRSKHKLAEKILEEVSYDVARRSGWRNLLNKVSALVDSDGFHDSNDNERDGNKPAIILKDAMGYFDISMACKRFPSISLGSCPPVALYEDTISFSGNGSPSEAQSCNNFPDDFSELLTSRYSVLPNVIVSSATEDDSHSLHLSPDSMRTMTTGTDGKYVCSVMVEESSEVMSKEEAEDVSLELFLDRSISCIPGLSKKQCLQLENCGFHTLRQLLHHFPRTYADLQNAQMGIEDGQYCISVGKVLSSRWKTGLVEMGCIGRGGVDEHRWCIRLCRNEGTKRRSMRQIKSCLKTSSTLVVYAPAITSGERISRIIILGTAFPMFSLPLGLPLFFSLPLRQTLSTSPLGNTPPRSRLLPPPIISQNRSRKVRVTDATREKNLSKALRILDLVVPKISHAAKSNQSHLRLIQDFLQTGSSGFSAQQFSNDFDRTKSRQEKEVTQEFGEMVDHKLAMDFHEKSPVDGMAVTLSKSLSSFVSTRDLCAGFQYHCLAIRTGFIVNVYVGSSLISLYCKCGELGSAYKVFEEMPMKNVVSWTTIISGFAQEWQIDMCLELYCRMRISISKPNDFTFASLLSACTGSGALGQGRSAHCQTIQMGLDSHVHIVNALISMYGKCGNVGDAFFLFENMVNRDIVSWNSMIAGYAQHGLACQAIGLFEEMKKQNMKPDAITFLGVLSSCRHAGLVKEGQLYFSSMIHHGVKPELDHYSCVADLLGRAGLLEEALDFVENMPVCPNAVIWGSLLSSCRLRGDIWIGIRAAENRLHMEPGCATTHVQLANLYASAGWWDQAARVRKAMKETGLKTIPGNSWIEIKDEVCRFRAEDKSNIRVAEAIYVVDSLAEHMGTVYGEPEGQDMEEPG